MGGFCGWDMPIDELPQGVLNLHLHTRQKAGLFDVSHMGQLMFANADSPFSAFLLHHFLRLDNPVFGRGAASEARTDRSSSKA